MLDNNTGTKISNTFIIYTSLAFYCGVKISNEIIGLLYVHLFCLLYIYNPCLLEQLGSLLEDNESNFVLVLI